MDKAHTARALIKEVCADKNDEKLVRIKEYGRDSEVSNSFELTDLELLISAFVTSPSKGNTRSALIETFTIIANALVWNKRLLEQFDPHIISTRVINECFQSELEPKEDYLLMRLLFLLTFTGRDFDEKKLKTCLTLVGQKVTLVVGSNCEALEDNISRLTFIESLKLAFNLLHYYPNQSIQHVQGHTARDLLTIYYTLDPFKTKNIDVYQYISNVLLCIPIDLWLYQVEDSASSLHKILDFVENVTGDSDLRQDHILAPILSLIHLIVGDVKKGEIIEDYNNNTGDESVSGSPQQPSTPPPETSHKHHLHLPHRSHRRSSSQPKTIIEPVEKDTLVEVLKCRLLPSARDREQPLGQSDSLCSYLLQITIDPVLRTTRNIIYDIFWKLSSESPDEFVSNFGLGFASSFLASHGIAFPESVSTDAPTSDQLRERLEEVQQNVNPVTGQYYEFEKTQERQRQAQNEYEEMSEEEKLRDAEKMFVLFERLKSNNIIHVENPVAVAARNGQL